MLQGKPLKPGSGDHVPRRIYDPILYLVVKLWAIHGKGKRKIDTFLGEDLRFFKIVFDFDLLLVCTQKNGRLHACGVHGRALELGFWTEWTLLDPEQFAIA